MLFEPPERVLTLYERLMRKNTMFSRRLTPQKSEGLYPEAPFPRLTSDSGDLLEKLCDVNEDRADQSSELRAWRKSELQTSSVVLISEPNCERDAHFRTKLRAW